MPEKYGTTERAALIALLLESRPVPNPELTNKYGIELRPLGRNKLNKAGLLTTHTETKPYVHEITAAGIAWCEQELGVIESPSRSGPLARVGLAALRRIVQFLHERGISVAEVFGPGDLESLIRAAYQDLSVKPQDWVRLARLRPKLNGAEKDEVDDVLLKMVKTGAVHLAPDSNRKVLTDADHFAAVRIGGEDKHLMAIEES